MSSKSIGSHHQEFTRHVGEPGHSGFRYHHIVFDAHAAETRQVHARLNGEHYALFSRASRPAGGTPGMSVRRGPTGSS